MKTAFIKLTELLSASLFLVLLASCGDQAASLFDQTSFTKSNIESVDASMKDESKLFRRNRSTRDTKESSESFDKNEEKIRLLFGRI